jgi:hypothetical protein
LLAFDAVVAAAALWYLLMPLLPFVALGAAFLRPLSDAAAAAAADAATASWYWCRFFCGRFWHLMPLPLRLISGDASFAAADVRLLSGV